jgi:pyrrolysine biosynthesis protein PylD
VVLSSDDDDFICRNLKTGFVSRNGEATGRGFAQALFFMARGTAQNPVLVIGAGEVGSAAARRLSKLGMRTVIHDLDAAKAEDLARKVGGASVPAGRIGDAVKAAPLILEASTSAHVWDPDSVKKGAFVAAPGMPFSFVPGPNYGLWAEPLATGTAVMLMEALLVG